MITKEQAIQLGNGEIYSDLHENGCHVLIGKRGGKTVKIYRWRINGKCKVWKTRPNEFRLPIKWGFKTCGYLTELNCHQFHLALECPLHKQENNINSNNESVNAT